MTHSIPDSSAVALGTELGTVLITGDYKFDQTPVDGAARGRLAPGRARARGRAAAVRRLHQRRPRRASRRRSRSSGPHLEEVVRALRGADRGDELRVEHPPRAAGRRRRRRARPQGRAGRALDAQERRHRAHARAHRDPRRDARGPARDRRLPRRADRDHLDRLPGRAALGAAADGLPRPPARCELQARRHGRLLGHADPRQRARGQRDDRPPLPHRLRRDHAARRARARLRARLRRGGQADAQPRQAALRDALPRRLQAAAPARPAGRGGRASRPRTSSRARTGCRWTSTSAARASASASRRA